ncbi:MAG: transporter substrate-binding domain-containing protein [Oscillospiraceae bacterium]|nr:transporter substrate-binding domain-containing protein [Oscillospiraceae bacterium]
MKKITALILALVMVFALCACGNSGDNNDDAADNGVKLKILDSEYVTEDYAFAIAKDNDALLEKVNAAMQELTDDGTIKQVVDYFISGTGSLPEFQQNVAADAEEFVVATNATFPPYIYVDGDDFAGIDYVIAGLIADKLGMKLTVNDMEFDAIIPAVQSGKADMGMGGVSITDERKQSINFTMSYATGIQVMIVPEDSDVTSADDILAKIENGEDFQIGAQSATTGYIYASDTVENGGFGEDHVQAFPKGADAIAALTSGKIDCVIIDNEPAKAFVEANNG